MTPANTTELPASAKVRLSVGLAAHRDLLPAREPELRARVRGFFQRLQAEFPELPLLLISALAEGGDQLVAEEALALGIELMVPLPMPQAEYENDFDTPESLARFRDLLARGQVRVLPMAAGNDAESIRARGEARNRQYGQLGMFTSSHCQVLLALWDGRASTATGGTAQVVDFHLHNHMPGLSVEDVAPNLLADDESDLVFHIPCARGIVGLDDPTPLATRPRWLTLDGETDGDAPTPLHYRHVFAQMQVFNHDAARHARAIATHGASLFDDASPPPPPVAREIDARFRAADWLAVHFRRRVRSSLLATHALAALMGLSFILFSDVHASRVYLLGFLGLFVLGLAINLLGKRREWQRKYLDYRGLAEGLRVQLYWRLGGVETPPNASLGYDSFLQKQDVDLSWIRHAMRASGLMRDKLGESAPGWLDWVVRHWVGDAEGNGGQLAYYRDGTRQRERAYRITSLAGALALAAGLLGAVALLLGGERIPDAAQQQLLLAMGLLPLLAGIREAYSYKKADKELIKQFRFMSRLFASCRQRLDRAHDAAQTRQLLRALGAACMEEHAEWILLHRERPLEPAALSG
ncbi:MAG: hypothetical protein ABI588_00245 [Arenimonas sp.]